MPPSTASTAQVPQSWILETFRLDTRVGWYDRAPWRRPAKIRRRLVPRSRRPTRPKGAAIELGNRNARVGRSCPTRPCASRFAMMNRHGLIAGATGTGKTRTLQVIAEQLSAAGVAVFAADVKGDVSGMARSRLDRRPREEARDRARASPLAPHGLPGRVPLARRHRPRSAGARDGLRLRPAAAREGARLERRRRSRASRSSSTTPTRRASRSSTSRTSARCCTFLDSESRQRRAERDRRALARRPWASCCVRSSASRRVAATTSSASPSSTSPTSCERHPTGAA